MPGAEPRGILVIACGALAGEISHLIRLNGWDHLTLQCLPAELHNRPEKIPGAVAARIASARDRFASIFVGYADCGTGGALDRVLEAEGVARLPGAHCYEFYTGSAAFGAVHDSEPATFYLTDYLARHFDRIVWHGLGLDRHPELLADYFGNYRRLVFLAQTDDPGLERQAVVAAGRLGLSFTLRRTGYGDLGSSLAGAAVGVGSG